MANIPIERKSGGVPWWAYLLGALLLGALLFFLLRGCENEDTVATDDDVTTDTSTVADGGEGAVGGTGAPIVVLDELYDNAQATSRVGSEVNLTNVPVLNVVSDSAFFVGTGDAQRVLVVLEGLGEGQAGQNPEGSDGRFNIDTGDNVSVRGRVQSFAEARRGLTGLGEADRTALGQSVYVAVTSAGDVRGEEATEENDPSEGATGANANTGGAAGDATTGATGAGAAGADTAAAGQ